MPTDPHVSEALRQLRTWLTLSVGAVVVALLMHMLVYGFVGFTDVRWEVIEPETASPSLRVVEGESELRAPAAEARLGGQKALEAATAVEVNRVLTSADLMLGRVYGVVSSLGLMASILAMVLACMGVAVSGVLGAPGVGKVVRGAVWLIIAAMLAIPWSDVSPAVTLGGAFDSYADLTERADLVDAEGSGAAMMFVRYALLPMIIIGVSIASLAWFRSGVRAGVIVTSVSQLDAAVEAEIRDIQRRGVKLSGGRTVGALNRAMGAGSEPAPAPVMQDEAEDYDPSFARQQRGTNGSEPMQRPI